MSYIYCIQSSCWTWKHKWIYHLPGFHHSLLKYCQEYNFCSLSFIYVTAHSYFHDNSYNSHHVQTLFSGWILDIYSFLKRIISTFRNFALSWRTRIAEEILKLATKKHSGCEIIQWLTLTWYWAYRKYLLKFLLWSEGRSAGTRKDVSPLMKSSDSFLLYLCLYSFPCR